MQCSIERADLMLCLLQDEAWSKRLTLAVGSLAVAVGKFLERIEKGLHKIVELSSVSRRILANFIMVKQL